MALQRIKAWYGKVSYSLKASVAIALVAKLAVFILGYATAYHIANSQGSPTQPLSLVTGMFAQWDGPHYMYIAQHWYSNQGNAANFIVFFPLYPTLVRLVTVDYSYVNLSGLIVSNVASIVAVIYLFKLAKLDYSDGVAKKAVLFLCVFPTAYFLSALYTESLFLALVIASFYYARNRQWGLACALAFFSSLTRIDGLVMLPALAVEYLYQKNWRPKFDVKALWLCLPAVGFFIYLLINYQVTGGFFTFLTVERVHWYQTLGPLNGFESAVGWARYASYSENITIGYAEIVFAAFGYAMLGLGYKLKLRPSYQVYMLLIWMLAVSTAFWISVPRYVLIMFPMFLALGALTTKKPVNIAIAAAFSVGLFYFTYLFASGIPSF